MQSLILQSFYRFTYATAHSKTLSSLHLRHSSFYSSYVASPTSQALHLRHLASRPCKERHSPTLWSFHLGHSSFSNASVASHTPQLILQRFRRFTYVIALSPTLPSLHLRQSSFYNSSISSPTSPGEPHMPPSELKD